jgi:hypothetical protein
MTTKARKRLNAFLRARREAVHIGDGFLDVLNCGAGHLTFKFNKGNPDETEKAKKVIGDMLKRGYMIFILKDKEQKRVRAFDAEHEEYILEEPDVIPEAEPVAALKTIKGRKPRGRPPGVPMRSAKATAIGPSAGG